MFTLTSLIRLAVVVVTLGVSAAAWAQQARVAVAANFADAATEIATAFKTRTGYEAVLSFGSSGQFYTQIQQHAPFDVFLSADAERVAKLAAESLTVPASSFTYAAGKLVLWSRSAGMITGEASLRDGKFVKLALANPITAPYGAAAVETLQKLGLYDSLKPKIVEGASIAQTFQFVDTGNAELGFVALAQLAGKSGGSRWVVPQNLYTPIRQDAALLMHGGNNIAAKAFVEFLQAPEAQAIIKRYGYALPAD